VHGEEEGGRIAVRVAFGDELGDPTLGFREIAT
jgi:hypothetical protein